LEEIDEGLAMLGDAVDGAPREWRRGGFAISTDKSRLQLDVVHAYLARSYWAERIPREVVERSIAGSLCFGLYAIDGGSPPSSEHQVGFARLVTDGATFAWVSDVFVLEEWRGRGLAKWLMQTMGAMPELAGLRRWILATRDAHELYRQVGFTPLAEAARYMERLDRDVYKR
jgi:GNAT superfamily N-acetyltransferase